MSLRRSGVPVIDRVIGGLAPGLPLVLAGPPGCGRTVLALQLTAAALANADIVALLSAEPAPLLLRQAESLGLALEPHVRSGQLLLLELDPRAPASLQAAGSKVFIEAIRTEHPSVSLIVIDPITALTSGLIEEAPLRLLARDLIAATPHTTLVLTVETERPGTDAAVERVLAEVCGTSLALARRKDGRRTLRVTKTRAGAGAAEAVEFRIGASGAELIREIAAESDAAPRPFATPTPASPAPQAAAVAPAQDAAATREAQPRDLKRHAKAEPARILIVNSDDALRSQLEGWLEEHYQVFATTEGFEALSLLVEEKPDAILLEISMPRVTGYELLAAMHRVAPTTPILVLTGELVRPGNRLVPLVLGAADVAVKPIERFVLLHKLETLLRLEGPPPQLLDPAEAQALFGLSGRKRVLTSADFRERLARAVAFGERFDVPSTLLAIETPAADLLDQLLSVSEAALRFEDAILIVSKRRALVLLVAAELAQATLVSERLQTLLARESGRSARLRWNASDAGAVSEQTDWRDLFRALDATTEDPAS